jgi:hypothetical protein
VLQPLFIITLTNIFYINTNYQMEKAAVRFLTFISTHFQSIHYTYMKDRFFFLQGTCSCKRSKNNKLTRIKKKDFYDKNIGLSIR